MKFLRQSTAATVIVGPFLDKADGLTPLTAQGDQSANGRLVKAGTGAAFTASSWAHDAIGHYAVGLSTSHTDTVGRLRLAFSLPGTYCPVWEDWTVLPQQVYDSLIAGSDALDVSLIQWLGTAPLALSSQLVQVIATLAANQDVRNVTGSVTGSVGSVTGAVGSVTGAVGSVTGDVGGNVVGSVASVTGAVGSVTGDVGGKVLGGGAGTITGIGARADLRAIEGELTSGNNAELKLKRVSLFNPAGDVVNAVAATAGGAVAIENRSGTGVAIAAGTVAGNGHGVSIQGGAAGGNGVFVAGSVDSALLLQAGDNGYALEGYGGTGEGRGPAVYLAADVGTVAIDLADQEIAGRLTDLTQARIQKLDNLDAAITAIPAAPAAGDVADAVWDEALAGHLTAGTTGAKLNAGSGGGGASASEIADAVWDEALAGHATAGTAGKALSDASLSSSPSAIADAVLDEALNGHATVGTVGKALTDAALGGVPAPGAYTINVHVQDALAAAVAGAHVDVYDVTGAVLQTSGTTNPSGDVALTVIARDVHYKVRAALPRYSFAEADVLVDEATESVTVTGALFAPPAPSAPGMCVIYGWVRDAAGAAVAGVEIRFKSVVPWQQSARAYASDVITVTSSAAGYFQVELEQGAKVEVSQTRLGYRQTVKTVPAQASVAFDAWA